ncbi:MAG: TlpA family protein disulfide reductase [Actinomycetota bacterium]
MSFLSPGLSTSDVGKRLLVGTVLLLTACGSAVPPSADSEARPAILLPRDRLELPEFGFEHFQALLRELRGTPVVVNIWGSWCPPCFVEAPDLARVAREFEGRVQFLGVDILDDRRAAREFILRFDWPYPSVFDPGGEIRDRLGYIGQPITVIYDRRGDVAFEWTGTITADILRAEVRNVLDV